MKNIYDIEIEKKDGSKVKMDIYKNQVLLIVNTATACGFTPQYTELEELYEKYKDQGFKILDFPCNQFANQAPETDDEITQFCSLNFNVSFDQFKKIDVNGENETELYTFLKSEKKGFMNSNIKWNFTKFLVDRNGKVIKRYSPALKPSKIAKDIANLL